MRETTFGRVLSCSRSRPRSSSAAKMRGKVGAPAVVAIYEPSNWLWAIATRLQPNQELVKSRSHEHLRGLKCPDPSAGRTAALFRIFNRSGKTQRQPGPASRQDLRRGTRMSERSGGYAVPRRRFQRIAAPVWALALPAVVAAVFG